MGNKIDENAIVKNYYDGNPELEWERLNGFHFEFEITRQMLHRHLKKGSVLDIGGGPGRYSIYLASLGYDVTLLDLSDGNIELAKKKAREFGVNIKAYSCDARDLSGLNLGEYDNVLLMGPLYHLFQEADREKCVAEARKHLKKDGHLFASFITIAAGLLYYLDVCPNELIHEPALELFDYMEIDKSWSGTAFTEATFINNLEITPFFHRLGFEKITLFGQEGIAGPRLTALEKAPENVRNLYLDLSLRLCENPQYFPYSPHLMYIGRPVPSFPLEPGS
ncbi:class I SAM-dependent methyltransferase [Diplocloster agilis]|uniref:class I SAM-dependent methyltransferase n=1 Tax=Diplocloster agilis TaxID=2850323 RepID=UPI000820873A|nr:class I SAM-dependent methyltransferase [Suonthocola fibrivorans]MCU6734667.1 class I SAM-dependent methyltransferase [Suonthocola fibrivorans]SCJ49474.1 Glycine/sarcosine N-methyltransferase [uncultured Clostridium sp.]